MEKSKVTNQPKHLPKDAQVIMSILRDMDVIDYEPRVINQLLEFTYRYIACILEDAKSYANHAKKKSIDIDDVKLALELQLEQTFIAPPPREVLAEASHARNIAPLPLIKPHCGIRLPQDRYCLATSNLKLKVPQAIKKGGKLSFLAGIPERNTKLAKNSAGLLKRLPSITTISRTQTVTLPKSLQKFNPSSKQAKSKMQLISNAQLQFDDDEPNTLKRKRDEYEIN